MNSENLRKLREIDEDEVRQMLAWLESHKNEPLCIRLAVETRIMRMEERIRWLRKQEAKALEA